MPIYQRYKIALRPVFLILLIMTGILIVTWVASPLKELKGIASYVPLHTFLEFISIIISMLVFVVVWNTYDKERPSNFMLLACVFLGVGILDFMHAISYQGMPDFITPSGPEKAIDFWLLGRAFSALGLLIIAFLPWRPIQSKVFPWLALAAVLLSVGVFGGFVLLYPEWTPHTFIPGQGLTMFKVNVECFIIGIYLLAAIRFIQQMKVPQPYEVVGLFAAVCMMALSEIFFTLYADVTDIFNLCGHIYKVIAYGFIFNSIFIDSIRVPYQRMYESRRLLQAVIEAIPVRVFWKDRKLHYVGCNTLFAKDAAESSPENMIGKNDTQLIWQEQAALYNADDLQVINSGLSKLCYEEPRRSSHGELVWLRTSKVPVLNEVNDVIGVLGIYEDITKQKQDESELVLMQTAVAKSKSSFYRINSGISD